MLCGALVVVSSQAGSAEWRFTQNPEGGDYGHHMSRAACNIGAVLLSQELKALGIPVLMLHPYAEHAPHSSSMRTHPTRRPSHGTPHTSS